MKMTITYPRSRILSNRFRTSAQDQQLGRLRILEILRGFTFFIIGALVGGGISLWLTAFVDEQKVLNRFDEQPAIAFLEPNGNSESYRLFVISASGRQESKVADQAYAPLLWSPNGEYLAFNSSIKDDKMHAAGISIYDARRQLVVRTFDVSDLSIALNNRAWSATGTWLFLTDRSSLSLSLASVVALNISSGEIVRTKLPGEVSHFSRGSFRYGILWTVASAGKEGFWGPGFNVNASNIDEQQDCQLSVAALPQLTIDPIALLKGAQLKLPEYLLNPIIFEIRSSPITGFLALGMGQHDSTDIWLYDDISERIERATTNGLAYNLAWSPDGENIAYLRGFGSRRQIVSPAALGLYIMGKVPGQERHVVGGEKGQISIADQPWSPDGRFLAFSRPGVASIYGPLEPSASNIKDGVGVFVYQYDNGTTTRISSRSAWYPAWSSSAPTSWTIPDCVRPQWRATSKIITATFTNST